MKRKGGFLIVALALCAAIVVCTDNVVHITNVTEFINFGNEVEGGITYKGTTVLLDNDLSLLGQSFTPIGTVSNTFEGTFEGQGHVISDLQSIVSGRALGVFGVLYGGAVVQNIVIDSTCSFQGTFTSGDSETTVHIGSVVGYCYGDMRSCEVLNSINLGTLSFSGEVPEGYVMLGGVIGRCTGDYFMCSIKNIVNTGDITHTGKSGKSFIGGVIGTCEGGQSKNTMCEVINCLNYGHFSVRNQGKDGDIFFGGIIGYLFIKGYLMNAVNMGTFESDNSGYQFFGGCVGFLGSDSYIFYSYWRKDIGINEIAYGGDPLYIYETSTFNSNFELAGEVFFYEGFPITNLIEALNGFVASYFNYELSNWIFNTGNKDVKFIIDGRSYITYTSKIILLPTLNSEGTVWLDGWYTDSSCTTPLTKNEINEDTTLYGKWEVNQNNYTIIFNTTKGTPLDPIQVKFGTTIDLNELNTVLEGYEVSWWIDDMGDLVTHYYSVPARNVSLTAMWIRTHISTVEDFLEYGEAVRSGLSLITQTILLESDIDFSGYKGKVESIGTYSSEYDLSFKGTFDGQGHVIKNMIINSSDQMTGLFGYMDYGGTVKNIVIDKSCKIISTYSVEGAYALVGGFVGYAKSDYTNLVIESCVNMADVLYTGTTFGYNMFNSIGGFIGMFSSSSLEGYLKNCANYGSVWCKGKGYGTSIGGIVGEAYEILNILNSINSGVVMNTGNHTDHLYIGGIAGAHFSNRIINCVNIKSVSTSTTEKVVRGDIVGYSYASILKNSYWGEKSNDAAGFIYNTEITGLCSFNKGSGELNTPAYVGSYSGSTLVSALNAGSELNYLSRYSDWLINTNLKNVVFNVGNEAYISYNSHVILLPSISGSKKDLTFDSWYTDVEMQSPLTNYVISKTTNLYGDWAPKSAKKACTVSFVTYSNISIPVISGWNGDVIELPRDLERENYIFLRWEDDFQNVAQWEFMMPKQDVTLHAVWLHLQISTKEEFNEFALTVNSGVDFTNKIVTLENDIDLTNFSTIIGTDSETTFQGIFDGQGYTIRNFKRVSNNNFEGLFGVSMGMEVLNLVLDASCEVTSLFSENNLGFVGGIVGECYSYYSQCIVENCVNMGSITFNGTGIDNAPYVGGIISSFTTFFYEGIIRNCANYGTISNIGESATTATGGIIGRFSGRDNIGCSVQNCLNYGMIYHAAKAESMSHAGGIIGYAVYTSVEGCVNMGVISARSMNINAFFVVGSIGGQLFKSSKSNCYWDKNTPYPGTIGEENTDDFGPFDNNFTLESGANVINVLNTYADGMQEFSRWYLNRNNYNVTLRVNKRAMITYSSEIILAAGLGRSGKMCFEGWTSKQNITNYEIIKKTTLDGVWDDKYYGKNFTITFNTGRGGEAIDPITAEYGTKVYLPRNVTWKGRIFMNWISSNGATVQWTLSIPSNNMELTATWKVISISDPEDFGDFVGCVDNRLDYKNVTVFLENDIDVSNYSFSSRPIIKNSLYPFEGTFDGQGHILDGFKITTTTNSVGLFLETMNGLIIRNVVIGKSCSFKSTFKGSNTLTSYVSAFIGYCRGSRRPCVVEKCVNMASISYSGRINAIIGGISGYCWADNYPCKVDGSVNYGTITFAGISVGNIIGGIIGSCYAPGKSIQCNVTNNINSGVINYEGATSNFLTIGGISGYNTMNNLIKGCVNSGDIVLNPKYNATTTHIAAISGMANESKITNCYWSETSGYDLCGEYTNSFIFDNYVFDSNFVIQDNKDTPLEEFLEEISTEKYSTISFDTNGGDSISPLIIISLDNVVLPTPKNGGKVFIGWYTDKKFNKVFSVSSMNAGDSVMIYARWTDYDVSSETVSDLVQIVFSEKTLEDVKLIIQEITGCDDCFEIVEFNDYGGETVTIIKFVDQETSSGFVRIVKENYRITNVGYISRSEVGTASIRTISNFLLGFLFMLY